MSAGPVGARRHATMNGDSVACDVRAEVIVVYLDNCAIINLAKDKSGLGERFLAAIEQGGDVLLSVGNLVEIVGPQLPREVEEISGFLRSLGARWMMERLDPVEIVKAEASGLVGYAAFGENRLLQSGRYASSHHGLEHRRPLRCRCWPCVAQRATSAEHGEAVLHEPRRL